LDDVGVPDFLIEGFRCHGVSTRILALLLGEANGGAVRGRFATCIPSPATRDRKR
jgi:hypothetical protein